MFSPIKKLVPKSVRPVLGETLQRFKHRKQHLDRRYMEALFGKNANLVPPASMMFDGPVGYEVFKENGEAFLQHYIELAGLKPDERMLDVGSGIGRKTLPLTTYLSAAGSYEGIDIVSKGVKWCQQKYTRYPNFKFQLIDVYNHLYNPHGRYAAKDYQFPFRSGEFDFVVLNSVFTHMLMDDVEHYLAEVARVLKTGGRCLVSFFLLNDESSGLIETGKSSLDLRHEFGPAKAVSPDMPEDAVGFSEDYIQDLYRRRNFEIQATHYGSWCGREQYLSYQDLIVATKSGA